MLCLNEADGKKVWEHAYNDYLSDTVYSRYSVGSPTVDPETGWTAFHYACGMGHAEVVELLVHQ